MAEKYIYMVTRVATIIICLLLLSFSININQQRLHKNLKQLAAMNYILFVSVFSIVTSALEFLKELVSFLNAPLLPLISDILNLIFSFVARLHSCSNSDYVKSVEVFLSAKGTCRKFQSLTYLSLILFYIYVISSIVSGFYFGKKRGRGSNHLLSFREPIAHMKGPEENVK
ncbi:hypothetical protein PORY_002136 [Pneumocystis oryctolagi]|uniref:Uncharacterized protein n=1 Tax=Pneumocystis oryctolagi TaxID=42067 RepID=A0ACB7C9P0_9ASCO|nr:hypothetical protein PORY_002136 [Pneumocystis oryctolagi]